MTYFGSCLEKSGLGPAFKSSAYAKWGNLEDKEESFKLIIQASELEKGDVVEAAFTVFNESIFDMRPLPNPNGHPECIYGFDCGPGQINLGLLYRSVWVGEISPKGLRYQDVFGDVFYEVDQKTPCRFTGDPLSNLRMVNRKLLAVRGDYKGYENAAQMRVARYCGPKARAYRMKAWETWQSLFAAFFQAYGVTK